MANSYNSNPLVIDTDQSVGWKSSQAIFASAAKAVGIRVSKIELIAAISTRPAEGWRRSDSIGLTEPSTGALAEFAVRRGLRPTPADTTPLRTTASCAP